jgi:hypothetical protein
MSPVWLPGRRADKTAVGAEEQCLYDTSLTTSVFAQHSVKPFEQSHGNTHTHTPGLELSEESKSTATGVWCSWHEGQP